MTVSAALLVLDPPIDRLALLLEYLCPVVSDVVIVVDDRTRPEMVATMASWRGVTLVPFTWVDDFATARNAALPHCTGDWVLHVDPDELPTREMLTFIETVDRAPWVPVTEWYGSLHPDPRGYLFFTHNWFDGRQGEEWEEHWHCRLFRRGHALWYKPVHEQVMIEGMPEDRTRETPLLPKAPRSAFLIHSRMNDDRIDAVYNRIGTEVPA